MEWITGEKILERERWGLAKDLIDAYGERGLSPYREIDGARMTRSSKCFNCTRANQDYMPGKFDEHGGPCLPLQWSSLRRDNGGLRMPRSKPSYASAKGFDPELAECFFQDGEFVFDAGSINITNTRLCHFLTAMVGEDVVERLMLENACDKCVQMSPLDMGGRLKDVKFRLKDVEAYESGMWQTGEEQPKRSKKQVAQDIKDDRQKSFDRLLEKALVYAEEFISQNRRMRKDEDLYSYLCANSNGEEVSHKTKNEIWKKIPAAAKKGPGRPRCAK